MDALTVPTTIFSGFLGSGKTTIIMHLVEELQAKNQQVVYIKNEVGADDIDGALLKSKNIQTRELLNGCICCTLVGPFTASLTEVVEEYHPARIFIEASGAADPSALALMVSAHPLLHRDGVIGIIDVLHFEGYANLTETTKHQTKFIDLLVFNKVELASLEQKRRVVGYVRELNTHSPILEAKQGRIPASVAFGLDSTELTKLLTENSDDEHASEHIEHDSIGAFTIETVGSTTINQLEQFLSELPKQVFRAKGIVLVRPNEWVLCNMVGGRVDIKPIAVTPAPSKNKLVCIGISADDIRLAATKQAEQIFLDI